MPWWAAVDVPVTLKFRTGWDRANKNALTIARWPKTPVSPC
jgi:tRNA-dihydrouridine synthase